MGTDSIDYIIADKNIIPENEKKYYVEKVKYLPECYIPEPKKFFLNQQKIFQNKILIFHKIKLYFVLINSPLKMNPKILNLWMKNFKKVKNSVLWIRARMRFLKKIFCLNLKEKG